MNSKTQEKLSTTSRPPKAQKRGEAPSLERESDHFLSYLTILATVMYGDEAITTGCMSPKKQSCGGTDAYVAGLSRY